MLKLIALALLSMTITSNLFAEEFPRIQFYPTQNVSKALSVVEVLSSGRGSGVLALMDGKTVIVTNSHILQGKMSAMTMLPKRAVHYYLIQTFDSVDSVIGFQGLSKVLYDFPLSDVAILDLPSELSVEQRMILQAYALTNGSFSAAKGWEAGDRSLSFGDTITAVLQEKATPIDALEGFQASSVPDTFISGDGNSIWAIPVFARPGVSGGGFYRNGKLLGLVTKISLAGEPLAFATPFTKIAKLLYSPDPSEKKVSWQNDLMVYKNKDNIIAINPLGSGAIGNGGELTEVDESKSGDSNPNYWKMEISTIGGQRTITTWDPFVYRPSKFNVNNENVGFIKVKTKSLFKSYELFRVPTLASFMSSEKKGEQQTLLSNTPQNLALLKEARVKSKPNINFGRLYQHDYKTSSYRIYNIRYDNINGAQPLVPQAGDRWAKPKRYNPMMGPRPLFDIDAKVEVDKDGYFSNIPFSSKVSNDTIFDIKVSGEFLGVEGTAFMKAPTDLSQISIKVAGRNGQSEIILKPVEFNSPNSLIFKSSDGAYRAIYMYINDDLSRLGRIYIATEDTLMEFWTAE